MNRNKVRSNTNRKMDLKKKMTAGLAVGMVRCFLFPVAFVDIKDRKSVV